MASHVSLRKSIKGSQLTIYIQRDIERDIFGGSDSELSEEEGMRQSLLSLLLDGVGINSF